MSSDTLRVSITETDPDELKTQFSNYIGNKKEIRLSDRTESDFRLATYNIHYFTDVNETKNTYKEILSDIQSIDADVIGLEEHILGNQVQIKDGLTVDTTHFYSDINSICHMIPNTYNLLFSGGSANYGQISLINESILGEEDHKIKIVFDNSFNAGNVAGSAIFITSVNSGFIMKNSVLNHSINYGTIGGDCKLINNSFNYGLVRGNISYDS